MEELIRIILKWFKPIALVCGLAIVGSAIVSFMLPAQFDSTTTFLTTNPHLMDRTHLFNVSGGKNPVYPFGGKGDINRLLTLGESAGLKNYMIDKYKLYAHYEIDEADPQKSYWVNEAFDDHVKLVKTPKGMIELTVTDKDPTFAANVANDMAKKMDELNKGIINEKKKDQLALYQQKLIEKNEEIKVLKDSLNNLISTNPKDTVTSNTLAVLLKSTLSEYTDIQTIHSQQQSTLNQEYSTLYIIEQATPPVKRSKPVRWLIVLSTTLITLVVMMIVAVFSEKMKEWQLTS